MLDVDKMKQSLSSFSFSKEDTEFKPPKKTKGGKEDKFVRSLEWINLPFSIYKKLEEHVIVFANLQIWQLEFYA